MQILACPVSQAFEYLATVIFSNPLFFFTSPRHTLLIPILPTRVRSTSPTVFFNFLNVLPDLANLTRQLMIPLRIAFLRAISRSQQGINAVFCSRSVKMCCITSLFFPRNQPRPDESKTHNIEAKGFKSFISCSENVPFGKPSSSGCHGNPFTTTLVPWKSLPTEAVYQPLPLRVYRDREKISYSCCREGENA